MRRYLIATTLLFGLMAVAQTPNHNAVLITGDTPEASDHSAVVAEFQIQLRINMERNNEVYV